MKRTIWIARHGNRQDFIDRQWYKTAKWQDDPGLSPDGIEQAKELAERLSIEPISHIFSSPFLRTLETAKEAARALDLKIKVETGFSEWMNAKWFSSDPLFMPMEEKIKLFPEIDEFYEPCVKPNHPETFSQMEDRVLRTVECVIQKCKGNIFIVGHGASVSASAQALVGKEQEVTTALCSLTKISQNCERWLLELNGDISHLSDKDTSVRWI